ncbi:hypothetical protein DFH08DRAFT_1088332 [Mycena albidolilacea]|uniref:Uncharacterized protein n=1 Tax=Mycena albidolilacea TaxID=1033008 RepID=A0AAD6Z6B9_9AGAR|nr:hypothetical protein DFH08DRAFT_1088332 [Mycena albidolilacea]
MRPLPEVNPETAAAVRISAQRAAKLVVEARAERDAQRARAVHDLFADLIKNGLPDYITLSGSDFSESVDRCRAHETFRHYVRPRYSKILRARIRRYRRLKYEYELVHPPFSHPEFPEDPTAMMWRASADLVESRGSWGGSWGEGGSWGGGGSWNDFNEHPAQLLSQETDGISPFIIPKRLPFV